MERNWDPAVKRFFIRILNSVSLTLFWMLSMAIAGIYFKLGFINGKPAWYTIVFYVVAVATLAWLIHYLYRSWRTNGSND